MFMDSHVYGTPSATLNKLRTFSLPPQCRSLHVPQKTKPTNVRIAGYIKTENGKNDSTTQLPRSFCETAEIQEKRSSELQPNGQNPKPDIDQFVAVRHVGPDTPEFPYRFSVTISAWSPLPKYDISCAIRELLW